MRRIGYRLLSVIAILSLVALPLAADEDPAEDPWKGKTRAEIVDLMGEPQKVKDRGRDGETLTYKVYHVDPAKIGSSGLRLLALPGVGVVGIKPPNTAVDTLTAGRRPTDRTSGPYQPGVNDGSVPEETISSMYEDGEWKTTGGDKGSVPTKGKLKLRFVLDASGRVKEWSAGKK